MKVLVTGASGFVGSRVVRAALDAGDEVVVLRRARGDRDHRAPVPDSVAVFEVDFADARAVRAAIDRASPDAALHLGWAIDEGVYDSPENVTCAATSLGLVRGLVDARCPRIVAVGTHLELETSSADLDESAAVRPKNLYATAKDAVRRVATELARVSGTRFVWARLFNLYGPGAADWSLVAYIIRHLLGGRSCPMTHGEQERTFMHVEDAASALLAIARSPADGVVHVGSDEVVTLRALATRIALRTGGEALLRFGALTPASRDAARVVPDIGRLRREVGSPDIRSLDIGLDETVAWWRAALSHEVSE